MLDSGVQHVMITSMGLLNRYKSRFDSDGQRFYTTLGKRGGNGGTIIQRVTWLQNIKRGTSSPKLLCQQGTERARCAVRKPFK